MTSLAISSRTAKEAAIKTRRSFNAADIEKWLDQMAAGLSEIIDSKQASVVGIHTGGVWIAQALHRRLGLAGPHGELNIAFYRDDFSRIGMHPSVTPSRLPFEVEDREVVVVDDILYTGRTVRAAMNEIFDYGRPACIRLAVLVDRGGRELPIHADVTGASVSLAAGEHVKLTGPEPLRLVIQRKDEG